MRPPKDPSVPDPDIRALRVLIADDDEDDYILTRDLLLRIGRPACLIAMPSPRPCYELLVEASSESFAAAIAHTVDQNLNANPQYAYARALGQLGAVRGRAVSDLVTAFNRACTEAGMRLGDVKPPTLVANPIIATALLAPNSNDAASIPGAAFAQTGFGASALLEAT